MAATYDIALLFCCTDAFALNALPSAAGGSTLLQVHHTMVLVGPELPRNPPKLHKHYYVLNKKGHLFLVMLLPFAIATHPSLLLYFLLSCLVCFNVFLLQPRSCLGHPLNLLRGYSNGPCDSFIWVRWLLLCLL